MILDAGTVSIFTVRNTAAAGNMPVPAYDLMCQSYYGELDFEAGRLYRTEYREDVEVSSRIRIVQDRRITNHDVLTYGLHEAPCGEMYRIVRAYHGTDDDNGQPITDLSLQVVKP